MDDVEELIQDFFEKNGEPQVIRFSRRRKQAEYADKTVPLGELIHDINTHLQQSGAIQRHEERIQYQALINGLESLGYSAREYKRGVVYQKQ